MIKTDWHPTRDYMIVEPDRVPEKTAGGIVIPDQSRRPLNEGTILKIGPLVEENLYKPGDRVVFSESSEFKIKQDDDSLIVVVQEVNIILCKSATPKLFMEAPTLCAKHKWHYSQGPCPTCAEATRPLAG